MKAREALSAFLSEWKGADSMDRSDAVRVVTAALPAVLAACADPIARNKCVV